MSMAKGLPDTHEQSASAARSYVLPEADVVMLIGRASTGCCRTARARRGVARRRRAGVGRNSCRSTSRRRRRTATCASMRRWSATSARAWRRSTQASMRAGRSLRPTGCPRDRRAQGTRMSRRWPRRSRRTVADELQSALNVVRDAVRRIPTRSWSTRRERARITHSIVDMYQPRKRIDVGTWGIMGIGMGYCVAAAVVTGQQVIAVEGDSAFGFSGWRPRRSAGTTCRCASSS